jgi:hypothetical protein
VSRSCKSTLTLELFSILMRLTALFSHVPAVSRAFAFGCRGAAGSHLHLTSYLYFRMSHIRTPGHEQMMFQSNSSDQNGIPGGLDAAPKEGRCGDVQTRRVGCSDATIRRRPLLWFMRCCVWQHDKLEALSSPAERPNRDQQCVPDDSYFYFTVVMRHTE